MNPKQVVCRGYVRTLEDAVESWKQAHDRAMWVRDVEVVLDVALRLRDLAVVVIKDTWAGLFANTLDNVEEAGEGLVQMCQNALNAYEALTRCVVSAGREGYEVEQAAKLAPAAEEIRNRLADVKKRWPRFDHEELKAGIEQARRGELMDVGDVLRELQGPLHP